jgi:hypothetical protein
VAYEIADAIVYTNFFLVGLNAFHISPPAQIAASDINADGMPLSIADLVYLIRVIIGDAVPYPKVIPETPVIGVECSRTGPKATVSIDSEFDIGAALMIFDCDQPPVADPVLLDGAGKMEMKYIWADGRLRILIYSFERDGKIPAGIWDLVEIRIPEGARIELTEMEMADYYGRELDAGISNNILPKMLELSQNYPNPFNPRTSFTMALPKASDYTLVIYNIMGQTIRTWTGSSEAGYVTFEWDGTDEKGSQVASGIYFYRAEAADNQAIRKMILLK